MKNTKVRKTIKRLLIGVLVLGVLGAGTVLCINLWVTGSVSDRVLTEQAAADLQDVDCVIVFGLPGSQ